MKVAVAFTAVAFLQLASSTADAGCVKSATYAKQSHKKPCATPSKPSRQSKQHPAPAPAPATWPNIIPPFRPQTPLGFVHIPKTGGTAMKDHLRTHSAQCPALVFTKLHVQTEVDWQKKGYHTVAILRDPAERFRSAFDYARGGSEKYATTHMAAEAAKFADANAFANALRADTKTRSNLAWKIVKLREKGVQFRAASSWLNGNATKRHVVCYSEKLTADLSRIVNNAEIHIGQPRKVMHQPCAIKTGKRNVSKKHSKGLTDENLKWVRSYYGPDYALFKRYCHIGSDIHK